ncbi:ATP-binding protein [Prevotella sp.]|uniref:ATP-binding protein n=1 Tax=Prevotella sp. TaxID=59823 RepID=UPI00307C80B4
MKHTFAITPRVIAHLGEDLIKNENIALVELVKNSYDAQATFCEVEFFFIGDELSKITITDDGVGMDLDTIENAWLVIGTDNKKKQLEHPSSGRLPLGEKGIGRLGVHKLGRKIQIQTHKFGYNEVVIDIDWTKLEKANSIDDFPIQVTEQIPSSLPIPHGTKITISDLKGDWNRRKLRNVYRDLASLNSPFNERTDSFVVEVKSNTNVFEGLPPIADILKVAMYRGHCVIDGDEIKDFYYQFTPWESLSNIQGREVRALSEEDKYLKRRKDIATSRNRNKIVLENFSLSDYKIGKIILDFFIFEKDTAVFSFMNMERTILNNYLRENSGVRVYRDGVRIYNYGEKDSDWLSLDLNRLKRAGDNISNNIIIGSVGISRRESTDLKEKTNREGFIENEAYFAFVDAVTYALDLITRYRNTDKRRLINVYKKDKRVIEPVLSDLNSAVEIIKDKVSDEKAREDILHYLNRVNDQYIEVRDILIRSANAGLNLGGVIHDMEKQVDALISCIENNNFESVKNIALNLEHIISGYTVFLKKTSIKTTNVSTIVSAVIDNNKFRFADHRIKIYSNRKNVDFEAKLSQTESIGALTNLIDNSIYWVSQSRQDDRKIYVYITDEIDNYISIVVCDNGCGFKMPPEQALRPFITGKPLNTGMGLGLHIAHEVMQAMKGKLLILDANEIDLPDTAKKYQINKAIVALCFPKA